MYNFSKVITVFTPIDEINITEYFSEYDHYEPFDTTKNYTTEKFEENFGHGNRTYRYAGMHFFNKNDSRTVYVVAEEILDDDQKCALAKYCQCSVCTAKWYNLFKYITCSCCIGCLKTDLPRQSIIGKTRKYIADNNISV